MHFFSHISTFSEGFTFNSLQRVVKVDSTQCAFFV